MPKKQKDPLSNPNFLFEPTKDITHSNKDKEHFHGKLLFAGLISFFVFTLVAIVSIFLVGTGYESDPRAGAKVNPISSRSGSTISYNCSQASVPVFGTQPPPSRSIARSVTQLQQTTSAVKSNNTTFQINPSQTNQKNFYKSLRDRKQRMMDVMLYDPTSALPLTLSIQEWLEAETAASNCAERKTVLEGTLEIIHADDFDNEIAYEEYTLVIPGGDRIILHPAKGTDRSFTSGTLVEIRGFQLDDHLLFDGTTDITVLQPVSGHTKSRGLATLGVSGNQRVLAVLANFQNTTQPSVTKEEAEEMFFTKVRDYYSENSYNTVNVIGDVADWVTIPVDKTCSIGLVYDAAVEAVDPVVDFTLYDYLFVYAPFQCQWAGIASGLHSFETSEGEITLETSYIQSNLAKGNGKVTAHELGHTFGIWGHANYFDCENVVWDGYNCPIKEYGDIYDVMGIGNSPSGAGRHFNAPHKKLTRWLNTADITDVTADGTYTIAPLESDGPSTEVLQILRKPNTAVADNYLYIEYRQPIGFDADMDNRWGIPTDVFEGALLHVSGDYWGWTTLLDPTAPPSESYTTALKVGDTFVDPTSGTSVTVVATSTSELTMQIEVGDVDFFPPTVNITTPSNGNLLSGEVMLAASASDNDAIDRVEFYIGNGNYIATDTTFPYEVTFDTRNVQNRTHTFTAHVYDLYGNRSISDPVTISTENPDTLTLGEVTGDGYLDSDDIAVLQDYVNTFPVPDVADKRIQLGCGDIDNDGATTVSDLSILEDYVAGNTVPYPVGAAECPYPQFLGDVNADGEIDVDDGVLVYNVGVLKGLASPIVQRRVDQMCADVNKDGDVTPGDALYIFNYADGNPVPYPIGTEACPEALILPGDIDGNGQITPQDAQLVHKYLLEQITFTPAQEQAAEVTDNSIITITDAEVIFDAFLYRGFSAFPILFGDVDFDGQVTMNDAAEVFSYFADPNKSTPTQKYVADVDGNGKISPGDSQLVAQFANGLITEFPADPSQNHPMNPTNLSQHESQGSLPISEGSTITSTTPSFQYTIQDYDQGQVIGYRIQVARDKDFIDLARDYTWVGSTENPKISIFNIFPQDALIPGSYWWRVQGTDDQGAISDWVYFGNRDAADFEVISAQSHSLTSQVSNSNDDAEERVSRGKVSLSSSDLELVNDGSKPQEVGMRFTSITIPQGSTITNAYIEFVADEKDSKATNLTFFAEDTDNTQSFSSTKHDITDRSKTVSSVAWNNVPAWNSVGQIHQTPDLSPIIQEVINRLDWISGNAISIIVTGSGERTAESYNGSHSKAPKLMVEWVE